MSHTVNMRTCEKQRGSVYTLAGIYSSVHIKVQDCGIPAAVLKIPPKIKCKGGIPPSIFSKKKKKI